MELPKELTTVTTTSKIIAMLVFIALPFLGFFAGTTYQASITSKSTENNIVPTPKTITSQSQEDLDLTFLKEIQKWAKEGIQWEEVKQDEGIFYFLESSVKGYSRKGLIRRAGYVGDVSFGVPVNTERLKELGWEEDYRQAADGIDGSISGYRKKIGDKQKLLQFSSKATPLTANPQEGMEFDLCPCSIEYSIFLSSEF